MERDCLIESHLKLVPPIARRVKKKLPPSFDLDDLIGEGYIGLMHAAERYRPLTHGGTPFSAYARPRIRGAIVDSVRRKCWQENTHNPLDDAPEPAVVRPMPCLITGPQNAQPRQRVGSPPTIKFRADHLPKRFARALEELSARRRAILWACYGETDFTLAEVAEMLLLTLAQVEHEHRAALDHLRQILVRNMSRSGLDPNYFSTEYEMPIAA